MLKEIDAYIREHEDADRSKIVDWSLRLWYADLVHQALARQHSAPKSPEELEERSAWKRIRSAQMPRLLRRCERHDEV